jgi:cyanophycinase-like exopeptidase
MTKFILQGGYTGAPIKSNTEFYQEIVRGLKEPITILCVYFASEKEKWPGLFEQEQIRFKNANPEIKMNFIMATEENFVEKAKEAQVIFLRGGPGLIIYQYFKNLNNLKSIFKNKVVVGSSAGAYALSKYFYSNDDDKIEEGAGMLPIKVFCHFSANKNDKLEKLRKHGENLPIYTISDYKYVVLER